MACRCRVRIGISPRGYCITKLKEGFKMSNYGITTEQARACIENYTPFSTGTLSGQLTPEGDFLVHSYGVLIAKAFPFGATWTTLEKYSQTTSRHLNIVKKAWGI